MGDKIDVIIPLPSQDTLTFACGSSDYTWLVNRGDHVSTGQPLIDFSGRKIVSPVDGIVKVRQGLYGDKKIVIRGTEAVTQASVDFAYADMLLAVKAAQSRVSSNFFRFILKLLVMVAAFVPAFYAIARLSRPRGFNLADDAISLGGALGLLVVIAWLAYNVTSALCAFKDAWRQFTSTPSPKFIMHFQTVDARTDFLETLRENTAAVRALELFEFPLEQWTLNQVRWRQDHLLSLIEHRFARYVTDSDGIKKAYGVLEEVKRNYPAMC